jgi:hypothetical protein
VTFLCCLANLTTHASLSDIDFGLVGCALVGFAAQECEVLGTRSILELLDVGVVDAETELVQFALNTCESLSASDQIFLLHILTLDDLFLEDLSLKSCISLTLSKAA